MSVKCDWIVIEFQSHAVVRHDEAWLESTSGSDVVVKGVNFGSV